MISCFNVEIAMVVEMKKEKGFPNGLGAHSKLKVT